ncbi:MAG: hypothetical protein ACI8PZ_004976 [Myxococcota bacterium]|jgi:hypothetical protein
MWLLLLLACASKAPSPDSGSPPADADTDTDSDADTDSDTDADTDTDSDTDADTDTDSDTDTDREPGILALSAFPRWTGEGEGDWLGRWVGAAGDLDGDGGAEWMATALWNDAAAEDAGAVYLLGADASPGPIADTARGAWTGEGAHDAAGVSAAAAGDVDGDGRDDLIIGADGHDLGPMNSGAAYLVRGPATGVHSLAEAASKLVGESRGDLAGVSVAGVGDVSGDGLADVLIGARYDDEGGEDAGAAYLVLGPGPRGTGRLGEAPAKLVGEAPGDWAGIHVGTGGDLTGDGVPDLVVGASFDDTGSEDAGATYVVAGPALGTLSLDSAAKRWGEAPFDEASRGVGGGDVDGDGRADLLIGARFNDRGADDGGATYLVRGPVAGRASLTTADAVVLGSGAGDQSGFRVDLGGDVDGDGHADLLIASWLDDTAGEDAGAAVLIHGPVEGVHDLAEGVRLVGTNPGDIAGSSVGFAGDIDGDGRVDLAIGSSLSDVSALDAGAIHLVLSAEL